MLAQLRSAEARTRYKASSGRRSARMLLNEIADAEAAGRLRAQDARLSSLQKAHSLPDGSSPQLPQSPQLPGRTVSTSHPPDVLLSSVPGVPATAVTVAPAVSQSADGIELELQGTSASSCPQPAAQVRSLRLCLKGQEAECFISMLRSWASTVHSVLVVAMLPEVRWPGQNRMVQRLTGCSCTAWINNASG